VSVSVIGIGIGIGIVRSGMFGWIKTEQLFCFDKNIFKNAIKNKNNYSFYYEIHFKYGKINKDNLII
tara:strand:+ start:1212 stop:1412 length:201 start_codon:yes stop_codon:yes gene_type:complete